MNGEVPRAAELVIIGGGAVGCSLAYHLAQNGRRPLVLERDVLGSGSTGRCAGGVRQQFSTAINVLLGRRSIELLREFRDQIGVDPGYRPIGYMLLASDHEHAAMLQVSVAKQQALGVESALIDAAAARELVPGLNLDDIQAVSWCPTDGLAGPYEVTNGYAAAARRLGATVVEGTTVLGIEVGGGRVTAVETSSGRIATESVIDCAGPQAHLVGSLAGVEVPVVPVRHQVFVTDGFDGQPPNAPMTIDLVSTFYFHQEGAGLMMGMGDPHQPPGEDLSADWDFLRVLGPVGERRLPALGRAAIRAAWAGLYEMTPDHQPLVGQVAELEGFWVACGFSGHGFMMAPSVGESLAQQMCGEKPRIDLSAFGPERFDAGGVVPELVVV